MTPPQMRKGTAPGALPRGTQRQGRGCCDLDIRTGEIETATGFVEPGRVRIPSGVFVDATEGDRVACRPGEGADILVEALYGIRRVVATRVSAGKRPIRQVGLLQVLGEVLRQVERGCSLLVVDLVPARRAERVAGR